VNLYAEPVFRQYRWNIVFEGSKVDVLNKHAESPLHLAIRMMHADIVQLLVDYGY